MNQPLRALHPSETPALFSVDEFMQLVSSGAFEGGGKVELVEGVIVRMAPALTQHMWYQRRVSDALRDVYREVGSSRVVQVELTLRLGTATVRDADVGILDDFEADAGFVDPATVLLLVEIAHSTRSRDLGGKREDYARAGVPHYWVVDIDARRTHVMSQPLDGDYAERHPVAFGVPLAVPETDRTIVID